MTTVIDFFTRQPYQGTRVEQIINRAKSYKITASRILPSRFTRDPEQAKAIRYMQENGFKVDYTTEVLKFTKDGKTWETHNRFTMAHAEIIAEFG